MTAVAFVCLILAASALAMCCVAWCKRFTSRGFGEPNQADRGKFRRIFAVAALLSATSSAAMYVAFVLLWAYSRSFNGGQPLGAAAIWAGLISSVYAAVGGLFADGMERPLIVLSSSAVAFLWALAGAASAAV
jgi:hypothetical protein